MPRWAWLILSSCILVIGILQAHNLVHYPWVNGFDARAHIDYIVLFQTNHGLPLATEGWEFHQPPTYYWLAHWLPNWKTVQSFGIIGWLVFVLVTYRFFQKNTRSYHRVWLVSLAALSPLGLYLSPAISNEWWSTVLVTLALVYYVDIFLPTVESTSTRIRFVVVGSFLGVILSLCLLTKVTAVVLVGSIVLERGWAHWRQPLQIFKHLAIPFGLTAILSGWFFVRNIILYGSPLFQAADYIPLSSYAQPIVARDWHFFTNLQPLLTLRLFEAQYSSFWGGTFFSWFYDGHGVLLPPQAMSKAGTLLIMLWTPLFLASVWGFIKSVRMMVRSNETNQHLHILPVYTISLMAAYIQYNFRLPFYSTVKAAFISSLLLPFVWFTYLGIPTRIWQRKLLWLFYLGLLTSITFRHFWINGSWYR